MDIGHTFLERKINEVLKIKTIFHTHIKHLFNRKIYIRRLRRIYKHINDFLSNKYS